MYVPMAIVSYIINSTHSGNIGASIGYSDILYVTQLTGVDVLYLYWKNLLQLWYWALLESLDKSGIVGS